MYDPLIITNADPTKDWRMDLDIQNGRFVELPEPQEDNEQRQRVAVGSFQQLESIPGREDVGSDWASFLVGETSYAEIIQQVNQNQPPTDTARLVLPLVEKTSEGASMVQIIGLTAPKGNM